MKSKRINQEPCRCENVMILSLTPMESDTRLSIITSHYQGNACEREKQERGNHSSVHYLSLPKLMGNSSCQQS